MLVGYATGVGKCPFFHITQLERGYHLQQICVLVMSKITKKGHVPTPVLVGLEFIEAVGTPQPGWWYYAYPFRKI